MSDFENVFSLAFLWGLLNVLFVNLILSGDNALVIALAVRKLKPEQKKRAQWWGTLAAAALRLIFLAIAIFILRYPWVRVGGGLCIIYIAFKLIGDEFGHETKEKEVRAGERMLHTIWVILLADVTMSLENVLAVAAVAHDNILLLVFGVFASVPIIIYTSNLLLRLMQRFPAVVLFGSLALAWVGAGMLAEDKALERIMSAVLHYGVAITALIGVTAYYGWLSRGRQKVR